MKLTIKDIAKKAKVSVATVSRALNPTTEKLLDPITLKKINELAKKTGYIPQRTARSLREGKTRTIGLLMNFRTDTVSGYVGEIMRGMLKSLQEVGYDLKLISREEFSSLGTILDYVGIDGVVITHAYRDAFPNLGEEIAKSKKTMPIAIINDYDKKLELNQLYVDSYKASSTMAKYLIDSGNSDFYLIGGEEGSIDARIRKQAFFDRAREYKIDFLETRFLNGHFSEEGGYQVVKELLQTYRFRGILYCLNDAMAIGALRAIGECGLVCPSDIRVIGFDGIPQGEFSNPSLTTVKFPLYEMGYEAVLIIYNMLRNKNEKYIRKEFPFQLEIRKSC